MNGRDEIKLILITDDMTTHLLKSAEYLLELILRVQQNCHIQNQLIKMNSITLYL